MVQVTSVLGFMHQVQMDFCGNFEPCFSALASNVIGHCFDQQGLV